MGFKLTNEGKIIPSNKLILSERFILQEATDWPALKVTCTDLSTFVKELQTIITNDHSGTETSTQSYQAFRDALKAIQDAQRNISKVNDPAVIIGELKKYLAELSNAFEAIDPAFKANNKQFNETFEALIKIIKDDPATTIENAKNNNENLAKKIRGEVNTISKALQGFIQDKTTLKQDRKDQANAAKAAKTSRTVQWTNPLRTEVLTKLNSLLEVSTRLLDKGAEAASTAISDAMATEFNNLLSVKNTLEPLDKIKEDISKADPFCETIKSIFDTPATKTAAEKLLDYGAKTFGIDGKTKAGEIAGENTDWEKLYDELGDIDVFWKKYFEGYWKDRARSVEALGEAFRQECRVMGFDDKVNPFINFLKIYLVDRNYRITANNYVPLHDAVAKGVGITRAELAKVNDNTDSDVPSNMLVCFKDYYDRSDSDAPKYFDFLQDFEYLRLENLKASTNPTINNVMKSLSPDLSSDEDAIRTLIFYELAGYSVNQLFSGSVTEMDTLPALDGKTTKLRALSDVKKLIELFKNELGGGPSKKWDDEDTDALVTKITLNTTNEVKELLYTIIISYGDSKLYKKVTDAHADWAGFTLDHNKVFTNKEAIEKTGGASRPDTNTVLAMAKKIISYAEAKGIADAAILAIKPLFD